jgi:hypothetical protein
LEARLVELDPIVALVADRPAYGSGKSWPEHGLQ